jgi:hypothetical protein
MKPYIDPSDAIENHLKSLSFRQPYATKLDIGRATGLSPQMVHRGLTTLCALRIVRRFGSVYRYADNAPEVDVPSPITRLSLELPYLHAGTALHMDEAARLAGDKLTTNNSVRTKTSLLKKAGAIVPVEHLPGVYIHKDWLVEQKPRSPQNMC